MDVPTPPYCAVWILRSALVLSCVASTATCARNVERRTFPAGMAGSVPADAPYLKAHLRDGSVAVLERWAVDEDAGTVRGDGVLYDAIREPVDRGALLFALDRVVLFETNETPTSGAVTALAVLAGITAGVAAFCLTDTKACFGSCPTFYVSDGVSDLLQAEGFSASVAPSLEATDVDALYRAIPDGDRLVVRMSNEALETHVIRSVAVLAATPLERGRIVQDAGGRFWEVGRSATPTACTSAAGDCRRALADFDGVEYASLADSADLSVRENVDLAFMHEGGEAAVLITARQSLLSTYLFYQLLAYMGSGASDWIAALERSEGELTDQMLGFRRELGGIEVSLRRRSDWEPVGEVHEYGPIAPDVHMVRLPALPKGPVRIRLRATRGHWRIDRVGFAAVRGERTPTRILPSRVDRLVSGDATPDPDALRSLVDEDRTLVSMPGDEYRLTFALPDGLGETPELFLESSGYYLEWMREEWMREEDRPRAARMLADPGAALRELAPAFKAREAALDSVFWGSRYAR